MARDITELLAEIGLAAPVIPSGQRVAYHGACSLQHGQAVRKQPKDLLTAAGFAVVEPREAHLCCGSAGTYNLTQPAIASQLRARKVENLDSLRADFIASGNIGCSIQIASGSRTPVVHIVELLDWATGGPRPSAQESSIRQ